MAEGFPEIFDVRAFGRAMDAGFTQIVADYGETLEAIFLPVLKLLLGMEKVLLWLPWWVVLGTLAGLAFAASRKWGIALAVGALTFCIGLAGVWEEAMKTVALMVVATILLCAPAARQTAHLPVRQTAGLRCHISRWRGGASASGARSDVERHAECRVVVPLRRIPCLLG